MTSNLFIGMVTHGRSRFNVEGAAATLAQSLGSATRDLGISTDVLVSDRNDYNPDTMPIRRSTLIRSAVHQSSLEYRWRRYLATGGSAARNVIADEVVRAGMAGKRLVTSNRAALIRLLNIDLSHLRIMTAAIASAAEWTLVLEDDAGIDDVRLAARRIGWLMDSLAPEVAFVNLSESLSHEKLGVKDLLDPLMDIESPPEGPMVVLQARRPITNTVCATLYRSSYLRSLRATILEHGLTPVTPIDWRVNESIMDLYASGVLTDRSCVWVSPGIVIQRSMHDPV